MSMAPTVAWVGRLGGDPELRFTNGGKAVASFSYVVSERWRDANDEWKEKSSWFRVTIWGQLGENAAQSLKKGDLVVVHGRLEVRKYEADDGSERTSVDITADEVAPSLRWTTAEIDRTQREENKASSGSSNRSSGSRGSGNRSSGSSSRRQADPEPEDYSDNGDYDPSSEPF